MIKINGTEVKTPSSLGWGLMDLSSDDSGRTMDGKMHKDLIAQKRKLDPVWTGLTANEARAILQLVNASIYVDITYPDPLSGYEETRSFYTGDKVAAFQEWTVGNKRFSSMSFSVIEE